MCVDFGYRFEKSIHPQREHAVGITTPTKIPRQYRGAIRRTRLAIISQVQFVFGRVVYLPNVCPISSNDPVCRVVVPTAIAAHSAENTLTIIIINTRHTKSTHTPTRTHQTRDAHNEPRCCMPAIPAANNNMTLVADTSQLLGRCSPPTPHPPPSTPTPQLQRAAR